VQAHPELAGGVGHDHRSGQQPTMADGSPERAFGRDLHGIGRDRELVNAEPGQVRGPRRRVGEPLGRVRVQPRDPWPDRLCPRMESSAAAFTT